MKKWYENLSDARINDLKNPNVHWRSRSPREKDALIAAATQPRTVYCSCVFTEGSQYDAGEIFSFRILGNSFVWLKPNWHRPRYFSKEERAAMAQNTSAFGLMEPWLQKAMTEIRDASGFDCKFRDYKFRDGNREATLEWFSPGDWREIVPQSKVLLINWFTYRVIWKQIESPDDWS